MSGSAESFGHSVFFLWSLLREGLFFKTRRFRVGGRFRGLYFNFTEVLNHYFSSFK